MRDLQTWLIAVASCLAFCAAMPNPEPEPDVNVNIDVEVNKPEDGRGEVNVDVNVNIGPDNKVNTDDLALWSPAPSSLIEDTSLPNKIKIENVAHGSPLSMDVLHANSQESEIEFVNMALGNSSLFISPQNETKYEYATEGFPTSAISLETTFSQHEIEDVTLESPSSVISIKPTSPKIEIEIINITLRPPSSLTSLEVAFPQYDIETENVSIGSTSSFSSIGTTSIQEEIKLESTSSFLPFNNSQQDTVNLPEVVPNNSTSLPIHVEIPKSCICGKMNKANRIVGGIEVDKHLKYPWHVGIKSPSYFDKYFCGGTIINEKFILTAAHCFYPKYKCKYEVPDDLTIGVADHDQVSTNDVIEEVTQQITDIEKVIKHPKYDCNTDAYDFALIELSNPLIFSETNQLKPVCLPENDDKTYESESGTVTGWGVLDYNTMVQPNILNEVTLPIMAPNCGNKYGSLITPQMICTQQPGGRKDACLGDSGGPLVVNEGSSYVLVGVVSWGYDCAKPKWPGVYARVTSVLDWIQETSDDAKWCSKEITFEEITNKGGKINNNRNKHINLRKHKGLNRGKG